MFNITPQIRGTIYTLIMEITLLYAGYSWAIGKYFIAFAFLFVGQFSFIRLMRAEREIFDIGKTMDNMK